MVKYEEFFDFRSRPKMLQEIGLIALNFSMLESELCKLLAQVIDAKDRRAASAIFEGVDNNRSRRGIIIASARICLGPKHATLVAAIEKAMDRVKGLAGRRNTLFHTPWLVQVGKADRIMSGDLELQIWGHPQPGKIHTIKSLEKLNADLEAEIVKVRGINNDVFLVRNPSLGKSRSPSTPRKA